MLSVTVVAGGHQLAGHLFFETVPSIALHYIVVAISTIDLWQVDGMRDIIDPGMTIGTIKGSVYRILKYGAVDI